MKAMMARLAGSGLLAATALAGGLLANHPAEAQSASQLAAIQAQIQQLQAQLRRLQREAAARDAALKRAQDDAAQARAQSIQAVQQSRAVPATAAPVSRQGPFVIGNSGNGPSGNGASLAGPSPQAIVGTDVDKTNPTFRLGGVTLTLGGFVDLAGIYRSRNLTSGTGTTFNAIPFSNSQNAHTSELRGTAQYSRFSMLVQGHPDAKSTISGYGEFDFNASAASANSYQSNSYTPRIRNLYATYDDSRYGIHILAGQSWSLLTPEISGIVPRKEQIPLTINTNYLPGFTQTRNPQLRVVKDFDSKYWIGASLEAPQAAYSFATASGGVLPLQPGQRTGSTIDYSNPGNNTLNPTANYSIDVAPDIIVKAAADPGFGHYEAYGLGRFLKSRVSTLGAGNDKVAFAGGVGGAATLPLIPKYLDVTGNVLAGYGVGRYGAGQLPDATFKADGSPAPLPELMGLVGLIGHPVKSVDLYAYAGMDQIGRKTFTSGGTTYGYGSSAVNDTGCTTELGTCNAQTRSLVSGAVGVWWRVLRGGYGTVLTGAQYEYIKRIAFHGVGGTPRTDENGVFVSLRYLPFQ